jgi:hypothetical protein
MIIDRLKFLFAALAIAAACGLISAPASAGNQPGPEIGTILVAEQAAGSPTMAPPMNKMKDKMVRKGERLITGPFGRMHVRFKDGSEISIGAEAELTLDELIYSPDDSAANRFEVSVVGGAFRYVSGGIAKLNRQQVYLRTPLATIGIRGTHVLAIVDENYAGCIVLLETPGAKGKPSAITVTANGQSVTINKPGWGTEVAGKDTAPAKPRTWSRERIRKMLKMAGSDPNLFD